MTGSVLRLSWLALAAAVCAAPARAEESFANLAVDICFSGRASDKAIEARLLSDGWTAVPASPITNPAARVLEDPAGQYVAVVSSMSDASITRVFCHLHALEPETTATAKSIEARLGIAFSEQPITPEESLFSFFSLERESSHPLFGAIIYLGRTNAPDEARQQRREKLLKVEFSYPLASPQS